MQLCVVLAVAVGAQSRAQDLPRGSYLLERCSANNDAGDPECFMTIFTVMTMVESCAPPKYDLYKLQKTVLQVLRDNPKRLREAYTRSVLIAANQLYPCPGTKTN
jgi:hypothetical protein